MDNDPHSLERFIEKAKLEERSTRDELNSAYRVDKINEKVESAFLILLATALSIAVALIIINSLI